MKTKKPKRTLSPIKSWSSVEIVQDEELDLCCLTMQYKEGKIPKGRSKVIASIFFDKQSGLFEGLNISNTYKSLKSSILQRFLEVALKSLGEICVDYHALEDDEMREWWMKFVQNQNDMLIHHDTDFWTGILTIY